VVKLPPLVHWVDVDLGLSGGQCPGGCSEPGPSLTTWLPFDERVDAALTGLAASDWVCPNCNRLWRIVRTVSLASGDDPIAPTAPKGPSNASLILLNAKSTIRSFVGGGLNSGFRAVMLSGLSTFRASRTSASRADRKSVV